MYINKIDDLIDRVIDDFFVTVILKDQNLPKIMKEQNFIKYQKELNVIMSSFTDKINLSEIRELVKSSDAVFEISETIKRYIAFYLFMSIGFNYTSKDDTYINNIVEFSKNQPEYGYKIKNFFNSESNSLLIKYNFLVKNILTILDADQAKIDIIKKKPEYREAIVFLNQLGGDYIDQNFRLEGVKNDKKIQSHNIIKTIIVLLLYKVTEKKEFFRLLEMTENLDGEYMFFDVILPKQKYIDFSAVEKLIGSAPAVKNLAYYFWKFLSDHEEAMQKPPMSIEDKILLLINSGILYPICDDFLLYHKESERYDKTSDPNAIKKKEDTKIRYVINKIETTSEYYSEQIKKDEKIRNNIKKNFYVPLTSRKAILVNHNEDVNIINKFLNQGKRSIENNDYFNDLINYKIYPYVNFKEFEKYGFSLTMTKTINMVRFVSVNRQGEFKSNSKDLLQLRVGYKDGVANIVGFIIPSNLKPLQCLRTKDVTDLRDLGGKNSNGLDLITKYLRESNLGTKKHASSVCWVFDLEKDSVVSNIGDYEQSIKHSTVDQIKHIVSSLYDNIMIELYYSIVEKFEKQHDLDLQTAYKILENFKQKIVNVPNDAKIMDQIHEKIYSMVTKTEPSYDKHEDIIFGISDDAIKLPDFPGIEKPPVQTIKINLYDYQKKISDDDKENEVDGICQHNVSWERISSIKKTDPKLYSDELYNYIQQYVTENVEQDYICKSCGNQLNIKKYIIDGTFDDDTQKFITYSMPMDVPLEDIPEYEKFKVTIRNVDKLIEKIAMISGIPHLMKSSSNVKWKKKAIIKDVIDLLIMNNKKLESVDRVQRKETVSKLYGINKDLSNLFVFKLDNSVFVFSSKDKDFLKPHKQNNIVAYLVFLIILEINDSQVNLMGGDKKGLCNFSIFDKILYPLFGGLKIIINNKGDIAEITNYKILCYMIYIVGCSMIKYNMWFYEYPDPTQKKKYAPILQKTFVNTMVDIMNSVLEFSRHKDNHYLYEIVSTKMFKKLTTTFSNEELYTRLKNEYKTSVVGEKKDFILTKKKFIDLSGMYKPMEFDIPYRMYCRPPRFYLKIKNTQRKKFFGVNNITNCQSGKFHEWGPQGGKFVCKLCNMTAKDLQFDQDQSKKSKENFRYVRLQNLASKFCFVDGYLHQFVPDDKGNNTCMKCHSDEKHEYTHDELSQLDKSLEKIKSDEADHLNTLSKKILSAEKTDVDYITQVVDQLKKSFAAASKDGTFSFVNTLLDELQSTIGNEAGAGTETYLRENSYIINHDHLGYPMDKNLVVTDKDNKIFYKQNHTFFKTDVIYYTSYKNGKIEIFYDATTKILLGYKEESKNYVLNKRQDKRLIINYSILNKLKLMGYSSQFIDVTHTYENMMSGRENIGSVNKDIIYKNIVGDLIRERITNLKKVIYEFQKILFRILNNYNEPIFPDDETEYFSNKINIFVERYKKNISEISITDNNKNHMVFKHWKGVVRGIYAQDNFEIKQNLDEYKIINIDELNKIDASGNLILFFISKEFAKLLEYNQNKFIKTNISQFIIDFINTIFELFNTEKIFNNIDIKRFDYILKSATYIQEISVPAQTEGIYDEYRDPDQEITPEDREEALDLAEEQDALDIESEYPYESEFDKAQDWEPDTEIVYNPNA